MQLISGFIDIYLNLNELEEQIFQTELGKIESDEREQVMQIVTSWMKTGIEQGIKRETELILRQLKRKIGEFTPEIEAQVKGLEIEDLENLGEALLDFQELEDLTNWLNNFSAFRNEG